MVAREVHGIVSTKICCLNHMGITTIKIWWYHDFIEMFILKGWSLYWDGSLICDPLCRYSQTHYCRKLDFLICPWSNMAATWWQLINIRNFPWKLRYFQKGQHDEYVVITSAKQIGELMKMMGYPGSGRQQWAPGNIPYFDGLMQERRNFIPNALELCLSCTNPSIYDSSFCCYFSHKELKNQTISVHNNLFSVEYFETHPCPHW